MTGTLRKCSSLVGTGTRGRWVLVIALAVAASLLEALGGVVVYVLIGLVSGVEGALVLPLVGDVRRWLPNVPEARLFLLASGLIAAFFLARAAVMLAKTYVEHRVCQNAGARLADRLARNYLMMPYAFHLRRSSAELIRNAFDTVQVLVRQVFEPGVRLFSETMIVLGLLAVLVVTAPLATALALGVLLPLVVVLLRVIHPRLRRLGAESQEYSKRSLQTLQESLHGVRDIKMFGREGVFADAFARSRAALARSRYRQRVASNVPFVATETVLMLAIVGVFIAAVVAGGGAVEALPVLGLLAYAGLRLKPSLTAIVSSLNSLRYAGAAIDHVYDDLQRTGEVPADAGGPAVVPLPFRRELVVDRVSFAYDGAAPHVLREVSLSVPRGASVGLVGPTGGGKTTLVDIIVGLLEPTEGAVYVDGLDIRDRTSAWRMNIGMVPQFVFLIDDTLRRNIAFGVRDPDIDEQALAEAIGMAQLEDVVSALPEGVDTVVGERGIRLSGGQRQRVAIARALYRRPAVVVFDEGTSALDNQTERLLLAALDGLRGDRTVIKVAHRMSTVRDCDLVALIEDGRLTDVGGYDELVERNAEFRELAR